MIYVLGLFAGKGAELERMLLFALIIFLAAFYAKSISPEEIPQFFIYLFAAYVSVFLGIVISSGQVKPPPSARFRPLG